YGSVENLLDHAAEVKNKRYREGLLANRESALQSKELARIRTDVPVEFDADALKYRGASMERSFQIFTELGFRAFAGEDAPTASSIAKNYRIANTEADLKALADRLRTAGRVAMRILPDRDGGPMRASVAGIALSTAMRDAGYVPIGHRALGETSVSIETAMAGLKPVFEDPAIKKIGHDLKFDSIVLARHGVTLAGLDLDTMLASYLIDATRNEHRLEDLALELVSYKAVAEEEVCGKGIKAVA